MSRREYLSWWEFHKRNLIDPVSQHQKPAALIAYTVAATSPGGTKRGQEDFLRMLLPPIQEDDAHAWFNSLG